MTKGELAVGVIGLGFGANHARVLSEMDGVRLAAVCDASHQRLTAVAQRYRVAGYAHFEAMLAREKLDAAIVAVPASMHEQVAMAVIRAGCAVLVEKPLAPSLEAGRRLVKAAVDAGVPLMAGHIERFNPAVQELAARVRAGEAGRVLQVTARRAGAIRVPPRDVNVVFDSAIHDIDAIRFVLGAEVAEVYAGAQAGIVTPTENALVGLLRFEPVNGVSALANLEVNWLSPRRLRDLSVLGDEGLFVVDYAAQTLHYYRTPAVRSGPVQGWDESRSSGETGAVTIPIEPREQLVQELGAFLSAVRCRGPLPVTNEDALAALSVAEALTESARRGMPVRPKRWPADD